MPESAGSNIEMAQHLSHGHGDDDSTAQQLLEIIEAIVLATVAIATAWSGYQAALWTGHQAQRYGIANRLRIEASTAETKANQERQYNAATVVDWLKAEAQGQKALAGLFERRFLPEFQPVFQAWKKTDPLHNPNAPIGPQMMPEYHSSTADRAKKLDDEATAAFSEGDEARQHSDDYVRVTVMLATVLLLTAISQRFRIRSVRAGLAVISILLLVLSLYHILGLPRA
jgi:hypothetical protein